MSKRPNVLFIIADQHNAKVLGHKNHPDVKKFSDLKRSPHIEGWLADMASGRLKVGTRRGRITCVRRFLCLMYIWGWEDAPAPDILMSRDMPRQDKYLPRPMTPAMSKKLDRYLKGKKSLMAQSLLLLRRTGMRVGEMMDLQLNCLEKLKDGHYVLHVPLGKLHTERVIPVDAEAVAVVKRILVLRGKYPPLPDARRKSAQFLLVRNNWRRPSYAGILAAFGHMTKRSGIETHLTPHQLRHTYATELLRCGISLPALMKLLGHKDISMTLRYAEVSQVDLQQAYHAAIAKNKAFYAELGTDGVRLNHAPIPENPDFIRSGIDGVISRLRSAHRDAGEMPRKKKIQRILERLSRVARDFDMMRKV